MQRFPIISALLLAAGIFLAAFSAAGAKQVFPDSKWKDAPDPLASTDA